MGRMAVLGVIVGAFVGVGVFAGQLPITRFFTSDMAVITQVRAGGGCGRYGRSGIRYAV